MQPFECVDELIAFLERAAGSLSVMWRIHALTLLDDGASGFRGWFLFCEPEEARIVARDMQQRAM